jgi:hypothetical protein
MMSAIEPIVPVLSGVEFTAFPSPSNATLGGKALVLSEIATS